MTTWPTGREATTCNDITEQDALGSRCLTPETTTISKYQTKLAKQARGTSVTTQRTVPIILYSGESEAGDESTFTC